MLTPQRKGLLALPAAPPAVRLQRLCQIAAGLASGVATQTLQNLKVFLCPGGLYGAVTVGQQPRDTDTAAPFRLKMGCA
jgi:hypothetical protein